MPTLISGECIYYLKLCVIILYAFFIYRYYLCEANNGIGASLSAVIYVRVQGENLASWLKNFVIAICF